MATCLSGIQPTGRFHIGNYLGCIKPFLSFNPDSSNKSRKNIFLVADMHCFTKPTCNLKVNESVLESVRSLIAIGVCSSNTSIVQQSKVIYSILTYLILLDFATCASSMVFVMLYEILKSRKYDSIQSNLLHL